MINKITTIQVKSPKYKKINIGDAMQTIASKLLYKELFNNDKFEKEIERYEFEKYNSEKITVIANGYYNLNENFNFLNNNIDFKLIGIYLENLKYCTSEEILLKIFGNKKRFIGCRDFYTYSYLQKFGFVNSYISLCMTLTFPFNYKPIEGLVYRNIDKLENQSIIKNCMINNENINWKDLEKECLRRLNAISLCEKIITNRVHTFFPSIAIGANPEFINFNRDFERTNIVNFVNSKNIIELKPIIKEIFYNCIKNDDFKNIKLSNEIKRICKYDT